MTREMLCLSEFLMLVMSVMVVDESKRRIVVIIKCGEVGGKHR